MVGKVDFNKIVLVSGGFDPIHSGHINLLNEARTLGDSLFVALNSDQWLIRKKGKYFMPFEERFAVVSNIKAVDWVMHFNDDDDTACDAIRKVRQAFPKTRIVFANGGDRTFKNIPEMRKEFYNVEFTFGVGGAYKKNSSSWLLRNWTDNDFSPGSGTT